MEHNWLSLENFSSPSLQCLMFAYFCTLCYQEQNPTNIKNLPKLQSLGQIFNLDFFLSKSPSQTTHLTILFFHLRTTPNPQPPDNLLPPLQNRTTPTRTLPTIQTLKRNIHASTSKKFLQPTFSLIIAKLLQSTKY